MSASNWAICPRCVDNAEAESAERQNKVMAAYGKVPVEEFERMRAESDAAAVKEEDYRTFREDYEFYGAEDGEIVASYGGGCGTCGLTVSLRATKRFWPEAGAQ